ALEEIIGKNPRILKSGKQSPEFYKNLWDTISSGQVWRGVFHNKRKDGSLYWDSATIAPVLNQDNKVVNYVAIKEDITARRQADEQLRKLSQAVEQSGSMFIIMDANGLIEYVNPKFTEISGYSLAEALGRAPSSLIRAENDGHVFYEDEWWQAVSTGKTWHGEFRDRSKDGRLFWNSATIAPVRNREGDITNYVESMRDITEQKILQDQLQKQNDYLSILHQITLDLLNRRNLDDLLQVIVERSAVLLDAPFSQLMLEENGVLVVSAVTDNLPSVKGNRVTREEAKL
ncbi:MAG: PAS domain-containing protein, partial [Anaerolineales bacterium]|nr:PAS domain-containing protein [Anaerolineales bacterium]